MACPWFDPETGNILQQINRAWKAKARLREYARVRDVIARQHDNVNLQVHTLTTVVRLAQQQRHGTASGTGADEDEDEDEDEDADEAAAWQDFFARANIPDAGTATSAAAAAANAAAASPAPPSRPRNYNHITRARNLALVVALWSHDVVHHYGWAHAGQGQLKLLRAAAERFPDFDADLAPRLNALLLARHCQAILHCRERTLNEAALQPFCDLDVDRLAATPPIDPAWEREWLTDRRGTVRLAPDHDTRDAPALRLREARPDHYRLYQLTKDCFGILVPRPGTRAPRDSDDDQDEAQYEAQDDSSTAAPPCPHSFAATASSAADDSGAHDWFDAVIQLPASPLHDPVANTRIADCAPLDPHLPAPHPHDSTHNLVRDPNATMMSTPRSHASDGYNFWSPPPAHDEDDARSPSALLQETWPGLDSPMASTMFAHLSGVRASTEPSQPSSAAQTPLRPDDLALAASRVAGRKGAPLATSNLKRAGRTRQPTRPRPRRRTSPREDDDDDTMDTEDSTDHTTAAAAATARKTRRYESERHDSPHSLPLTAHDSLSVSSPAGGALPPGSSSLEHDLHHRHGSDVMKYTEKLRTCGQRGQRAMRAQWLTPNTAWAKVWSPSARLGTGLATCEEQAEVLYYTSDDMILAAEAGTVFRKPIVVKERFTDHGMHGVAGFLSLVEASSSRPSLRVRALDKKSPTAIGAEQLAEIARAPCPNPSLGVHALSVGSRTHCHRPLFTMLPRFRLLDTLTEEFHGPERETHSKSLLSNDVDARVGFNLLALPGAFMGANVNSLCGCWVRNLHGLVYYTIVPESEMASEWDNFAHEGDDWLPCGRERLIVLEQDDVLFLPPGIRIVHASHSPGNCLMEGGVLWDAWNLPEILSSLSWSLSNPLTIVTEAFSFPMPRILQNLKQLVHSRPDKFRGAREGVHFLEEMQSTIDALLKPHTHGSE